MSLRENPLNCKTGKSEEPTVRTWEKQWIYSRLSYFLGKFNKFYCSWLYEIFPTHLLGLHASGKPGSSVRGVTFDHVIEHPGIRAMFFFFAYAPYKQNKNLSTSMAGWHGIRIDLPSVLIQAAYWSRLPIQLGFQIKPLHTISP